jgi:vancomycin resistance protein YoaR
MERGPLAMLAVGGAALALYLLLMIGSFVDPSFAGSTLGRNITVAGADVSGMSPDDLDTVLSARAVADGDTLVTIDAGHGAVQSQAAELGLTIDIDATSTRVRQANSAALLTRPFAWVGSFFSSRDVAVVHAVDEAVLHSTLLDLDLPGVTEWRLPSFDADATGVRVVPGQIGSGIDATEFAAELLAAADSGARPMTVTPVLVEVVPPVSDDDAAAAARAAEEATARPLDVTVGDVTRPLAVATLRSWLVLVIDGGDADWDIDHEVVTNDIATRFDDAESPGSDVAFVVDGGQLNVVEGANRTSCCMDGSSERIVEALRNGTRSITLEMITEETVRGSGWAESLGIVEEVASFTTTHPCCQNRVVNIQLIADAVRGVVIEPGQTFSMNDHVGRRTAEKGYLPAGGITNGVMVDQLGGGVSQFTTTLFNAAFFAGLEFGEYQAHSIYFSRYPYGREATLSFPHPDLQIRNTTPYGVLIWPTYTDTSITVTLYSTKHVEVEQTGQSTSPQGVCTRVRTERTRTYTDGREVVDAVFAVYRPREGVNCSGESTIPTEPPPADDGEGEGEGEGEGGDTTTTTSTTEPPPTTSSTEAPPPPTDPPPEDG